MRTAQLPALLLLFSAAAPEAVADPAAWREILGSSRAKVPTDPGGDVVWRNNLAAARVEAELSGKPLFVTLRCLPCKQCADFDKNVLEGSPTLTPLLRRFVTVRITDAAQMDDRILPYRTHQDLDLSWWGYFMSDHAELYGVFGGKDHVSESTRISEAALVNSLRRVLEHHYDPRRAGWKVDGPKPDESRPATGPKDARGYALLKEKRPGMAEHQNCVHCHQVGDSLTLESKDKGTFSVAELMEKWPLPENVGIVLDRDDGLQVRSVKSGSAAQRAGIRRGDRLGMANGTRLFGQADFRGVLHRAGHGADTVDVAVSRGGQVVFTKLEVADGWRAGENWWRKTVYDGVHGPTMGFFPLRGPNAGKGRGLSVRPWMGKKAATRPVYKSGLRPNMEIVAINGMRKDLDTRRLIGWFRLNHKAGDVVTYTARTRQGTKNFRYRLPE